VSARRFGAERALSSSAGLPTFGVGFSVIVHGFADGLTVGGIVWSRLGGL